MRSAMNWNTKPPSYSKNQSSLLHQWLRSQITPASPGSFSSPRSTRESCMYSSDSHPALQPLLNIQTYKTPQLLGANLHSRTPVAPQTSVEQRTYINVSGLQSPNLNLQMSSGIMNNVWLNSPMTNSLPHKDVAVAPQTDLGTSVPNVHTLQGHLVPTESYPAQLQIAPSSSVRTSVSVQGNERLNPSLLDAQQYMSPELAYPDNRLLPKQYSYSRPQGLPQESGIQKPTLMPSTSLQVQNGLPPAPPQTIQPLQTMTIATYQCAAEKRPQLPPPPYSCQYRSQPLPNAQPVIKQLSPVDVPPNPEVGSYEMGKDLCKGLPLQWQSTNENKQRKLYNWQVKQPLPEPVESAINMQTLAASNQGQVNSYISTSGQILDSSDITKEKLVRDIKSLIEIKKKFSEIARKIKINKNLLQAAGCSKTTNTPYTGPGQPSELSARAMPATSSGHCSMELLATCLSLWQKSPAQVTDESTSKLSMENQGVVSTTHTTIASSEPVEEGPGKSLCSVEGNSHNKMTSPSHVVNQHFESPTVNTTKGTEPQIAVVSPLILSQDKTLSVKGAALESLPEPVYPIIKEGSICSLQDQLAQSSGVPAALHVDVNGSGAGASSRLPSLVHKEKQNESGNGNSEDTHIAVMSKVFSLVQKGKQNEPGNGNSEDPPKADLGKQSPVGDLQTLYKSEHSTSVTCDMLQIGNICSLVEGNTAYDSQIANIFKSSPVKNTEAHEPSPCNSETNSEQQKGHRACEKENCDFQKEQFIHRTDNPYEISSQSKPPQSHESLPGEYGEANRKVEEKYNMDCTTQKDGLAEGMCHSSPPIQPNTCPQETHTSGDVCQMCARDPMINESTDHNSVLCLQDQLSELLKEFPYGIEAMSTQKGSVGQPITMNSSDNQTGSKVASDPEGSTDQIQITILSSEQMKEIFPEEKGQPCDIDPLAEPQKEKPVPEAEDQCASSTPMGEKSFDHITDKLEEDEVHCCALGWLSVLYEGVPHCQCKATKSSTRLKDEDKGQCLPLKISTGKGEGTPDEDVTIVECISISNKSKTPLIPLAQKSFVLEVPGTGRETTSRTKQNSPQRVAKELPDQVSSRCDSDSQKHMSKKNQDSSIKVRREGTSPSSSKDGKLDSLQSHKRKRKWKFHESSVNAHSKVVTCSGPASPEKLQKNHTQALQPLQTAPNGRDPQRVNSSLIQSTAPKKLKFRAGGSKLIYLEKRTLEPETTLDLETKKKKTNHQEQSQNAGSAPKLDTVLPSQKEEASVKDKVESNPLSACKSKVITLQEYLQRQKQKQEDKASKKICVESVLSMDPHSSRSTKCSAQEESSRKSPSAGLSKEPSSIFTSQDRNLKIHCPKDLKPHSSRNGKEKVARKESDKACLGKSKLEKALSNVSKEAEANQKNLQGKDQRKTYLNRVAFKCTERESICLSKLDSVPQMHPKDKQNREPKPKTPFPERPSMLEFKFCPDVLLKNTTSSEECKDLKDCPRKEQLPVQDNAKSKMCKRSFSADGCETRENPAKDSSKAVFQTYKQMYLEKRSRSLGDSPVK
ncbi:retroelement silencing factor 1 isoform X2 [Perognathus longimembris pacificus]|uniref:retroelement silencing factor 1 isoform X2 n=1 Tax=Perognathus longimembris pacificus TaxID=214514 RepID=UPI002018DACB|nr:retroelement silencing factor 1 isoform X2 [Perognathus longimembris pacificus]